MRAQAVADRCGGDCGMTNASPTSQTRVDRIAGTDPGMKLCGAWKMPRR